MDIIFEKNDDKLLSMIKKTLPPEKYNLIKSQPFYNQKTMTIDNILSSKLKEK
jgi:endonuclease III-like uncharacterized protein